ncbi:hypothetical protein GGS20DRAFT_281243 [Poronia punctata]|nr:hypothetical protein GGS20DRAFT_281243 [Poronia punctata]
MSDGGLYISKGECFFGEGQISDPCFIPCGNAAIAGHQACCFQGDFCLSSNVCYDNDTSVTYITGCTDATYSSSKCPHKAGYPDQQWVALARCDGDDIDLFSGCGHHKNAVKVEHEDCTCDAASALISNPAHGQPTLNQIALLPTTAGGTISFNPTALPTLPASSSSHSSSGGLSTGAKVGIGVGVGVGVPLLAAAIFFLFFFLRRKKRAQSGMQKSTSELPPGEYVPKMTQQSPPPGYTPEGQQDRWLGPKPELPAESVPKAELAAEPYEQGDGAYRSSSFQNTSSGTYPPSVLVSDVGSESHLESGTPFISPQSTGSTDRPGPNGSHARTASSNMDPISENRFDSHYN